jgi:hypothetical protein
LDQAHLGSFAGGVDGVDPATASAGTAQHVDAEGVLAEGGPVQLPCRRRRRAYLDDDVLSDHAHVLLDLV